MSALFATDLDIASASEVLAQEMTARQLLKQAGIGETLSNYGSQAAKWLNEPGMQPLRYGLAGAGVGGLLGLGSSALREDERGQPIQNALTGALTGAALGAGGGLLAHNLPGLLPKGLPNTVSHGAGAVSKALTAPPAVTAPAATTAPPPAAAPAGPPVKLPATLEGTNAAIEQTAVPAPSMFGAVGGAVQDSTTPGALAAAAGGATAAAATANTPAQLLNRGARRLQADPKGIENFTSARPQHADANKAFIGQIANAKGNLNETQAARILNESWTNRSALPTSRPRTTRQVVTAEPSGQDQVNALFGQPPAEPPSRVQLTDTKMQHMPGRTPFGSKPTVLGGLLGKGRATTNEPLPQFLGVNNAGTSGTGETPPTASQRYNSAVRGGPSAARRSASPGSKPSITNAEMRGLSLKGVGGAKRTLAGLIAPFLYNLAMRGSQYMQDSSAHGAQLQGK